MGTYLCNGTAVEMVEGVGPPLYTSRIPYTEVAQRSRVSLD